MKEDIKAILTTAAVVLPAGFAWLFYGKDILRWLYEARYAIAWSTLALVAIVAVVLIVAKLSTRLTRPKRYGTLTPDTICTLLSTRK